MAVTRILLRYGRLASFKKTRSLFRRWENLNAYGSHFHPYSKAKCFNSLEPENDLNKLPHLEIIFMSTIEVKQLRKNYSGKQVLTNVNLQVKTGEILALLGPNGAGKTTILEIIEGFQKPDFGHIRVLGINPIHGDDFWRSRIGIVLQSWRDHRRWPVRVLLEHLGSYYQPFSTPQRLKPFDAKYLLNKVGLLDQADTPIKNLSGGQRRRLDVAIGLVGNPEVLFLDEPTVGFDPEARRDFHNLIREIASEHQTSIVLTTHDLNEAENLADTIAVLIDGKISVIGSPNELKSQGLTTTQVSFTYNQQQVVTHVKNNEVNHFITLLLHQSPSIKQLQIVRPSLEDFYLDLISKNKSNRDKKVDYAVI